MSKTQSVLEAEGYLKLCGDLHLCADGITWSASFNKEDYCASLNAVWYIEAVFQMASRIGSKVSPERMFPLRINNWSETIVEPIEVPIITGKVVKANYLVEVEVILRDFNRLIEATCTVGPTGFVKD